MRKVILSGILLVLFAISVRSQELVAAVLVAEAGNEGYDGMTAVLNVVDNRARAARTDRLTEVKRRKAFSCLNGLTPAALIAKSKKHPQWKRAVYLVSLKWVPDLTHGALYYHEKRIHPKWADPKKMVTTIGHHLFYVGHFGPRGYSPS